MNKFLLKIYSVALVITLSVGSFITATPTMAADAAETAPGTSQLREAESLYTAGEYAKASQKLDELLAGVNALQEAERAQVYLLKARLELAFNRQNEIKPWLRKAYKANSALALDPVKDPPQLLSLWEELKAETKTSVTTAKETSTPQQSEAKAQPSPFWVGILPLGLGHFDAGRHKDGGLFLSTELLVLLAANTYPTRLNDQNDQDESSDEHRRELRRKQPIGRYAPEIFGATTFLGAYGYELYDMLPDLNARNSDATTSLRFSLSFMPFGVAQAKNGAYTKAFALGAVQTALITMGTMTDKESLRRMSLGVFAVSWAYGILDGVLGHDDRYDPDGDATKSTDRHYRSQTQLALMPTLNAAQQPGGLFILKTDL